LRTVGFKMGGDIKIYLKGVRVGVKETHLALRGANKIRNPWVPQSSWNILNIWATLYFQK
jgi:hypothetical protein